MSILSNTNENKMVEKFNAIDKRDLRQKCIWGPTGEPSV